MFDLFSDKSQEKTMTGLLSPTFLYQTDIVAITAWEMSQNDCIRVMFKYLKIP